MVNKTWVSYFFMFCLLLTACQPEPIDIIEKEQVIIKPPDDEVEGSISGTIFGDGQVPVSDVFVSYDGMTVSTDEFGHFSFDNVALYADGSLVTAEKDGYFNGSRKFYAEANQENNILIQLISKGNVESFNTENGRLIEMDMASLDLPSGEYKLSDSEVTYSGEVDVFGVWLDPTLEKTHDQMPGDQTGYDREGTLKALASFGMLALQLEDSQGNVLDLPAGETARLEIAVPDMLLEYAPPSIPLSYFDIENGSWIQEGEAVLENGHYVGEVGRMAFWNCNLSLPQVEVTTKVLIDDFPSANTRVKLTNLASGYIAYGNTTDLGYFTSILPMGKSLKIQVQGDCSSVPLSTSIGPFTTDVEDEEVVFISAVQDNVIVEGNLRDCAGQASSDGFVMVELGSDYFLFKTRPDGSYDLPFTTCVHEEIRIIGMDLTTGAASVPQVHMIESLVDAGNMELCTEIQSGHLISQNDGLDWQSALDNETAEHNWKVRTVSGSETLKIFDPVIKDKNTGRVHMTGAFVIKGQDLEADYRIKFPELGFSVAGRCQIEQRPHGGYSSYRFHSSISDQITIIDTNLFPTDFEAFDLDLVYYD